MLIQKAEKTFASLFYITFSASSLNSGVRNIAAQWQDVVVQRQWANAHYFIYLKIIIVGAWTILFNRGLYVVYSDIIRWFKQLVFNHFKGLSFVLTLLVVLLCHSEIYFSS